MNQLINIKHDNFIKTIQTKFNKENLEIFKFYNDKNVLIVYYLDNIFNKSILNNEVVFNSPPKNYRKQDIITSFEMTFHLEKNNAVLYFSN